MCGPTDTTIAILQPRTEYNTDTQDNDQQDDEEMEVTDLRDTDVLFGRGNGVAAHAGNKRFRAIIKAYKAEYLSAARQYKTRVARQVVSEIGRSNPPGRFLEPKERGRFLIVSPSKALEKTSQALREKPSKPALPAAAVSCLPKSLCVTSSDERGSQSSLEDSVSSFPFERLDCPTAMDGVFRHSDSLFLSSLQPLQRQVPSPTTSVLPNLFALPTLQQARLSILRQKKRSSSVKESLEKKSLQHVKQPQAPLRVEAASAKDAPGGLKRKRNDVLDMGNKKTRVVTDNIDGQFDDACESIMDTSLCIFHSYVRSAYDKQ